MRHASTFFTFLLLGLFQASGFAQAFEPGEVRITSKVTPAQAAPGEIVTVEITAKIAPTWHIYSPEDETEGSLPTSFAPDDALQAILGDIEADRDPTIHSIPGAGDYEIFEEEVVFTIELMVDTEAKPGKMTSLGKVSYMACDAMSCKPPKTVSVDATLEILPGEAAVEAEDKDPEGDDLWDKSKVKIKASVDRKKVGPGDLVTVEIVATIAPTWHIYAPDETNDAALPTSFAPSSEFVAVGKLEASRKPDVHTIKFVGDVHYFEEQVTFTQKLRVVAGARTGNLKAIGEFTYLPCTMEACLMMSTIPVPVEIEILAVGLDGNEGGDAGSESKTRSASSPEADRLKDSIGQGNLAFMGVCALFALLALLTPCVYPMIPITVSYFTKASHVSKAEAASHAFAYAAGIVVTYVGFGVGVHALLGDQGPTVIATNGYVNLGVAAIFVVFGLSLLGMFEIGLPQSWVNGMNQIAGKSSSYFGDLLMGFAFTLAAFTCTVPIVALILRLGVEVDNFHMFLGMLTYATVFAAPFFLLALMPSMIKSMPKSGGWLTSVKVVLAFIELAAAFKFLSAADFYFNPPTGSIFTFSVVVFSWAVLMLLCGVYLLGGFRFAGETAMEHISAPRMLVAALFLTFGLYLVAGGLGKPLAPWLASLAPPNFEVSTTTGASSNTEQASKPKWEVSPQNNGPEEFALAVAHATETGKPIFLEYSGFQ